MRAEQRFRQVYGRKLWAKLGVLSGDGSRVATTGPVMDWLESLPAAGMRSVLDLGCGDLEWISRVRALTQGEMRYYGIDVVPTLIEHHKRVFSWFQGEARDVEGMPRIEADVVLLKDVLFHLCNGAAGQILKNVEAGTWKRLLVSTHPGARNSTRHGLRGGAMAELDVEAMGILSGTPAFYLPRPGGVYAVWERS